MSVLWGMFPVKAQEAVAQNTSNTAAFAQHLEAEGHLTEALLEWRRLAYAASDKATQAQALYAVARTLFTLERYEESLQAFERFGAVFGATQTSSLQALSLYYMTVAAEHLRPAAENPFLQRLQQQYADEPHTANAAYWVAWQRALKTGEVPAGISADSRLNELKNRLDSLYASIELEPERAALAAIMPGMGHLMAGDTRTAMMALLVNLLFLWGLVHALRRRDWAYAVVFVLILGVTYPGSIFSAYSLAQRDVYEARHHAMQQVWLDLKPIPVRGHFTERQAPDAPQAFVPAQAPLWFYRNVIGSFDGPRSKGYPVNSAYAWQAVQQYGGIVGSWLTLDRLLRDWREIASPAAQVTISGRRYYLDPLARNTFWIKQDPWLRYVL